MDKPSAAIATRDIDGYEDNISLCNVVCQETATRYLSKLVEQIQYDRFAKSTCRLPSILLTGLASRRLVSKALANDLAFNYEEYHANGIGFHMGYSGSLFVDTEEETLYHLRVSSEPLMASFISEICFLLSHGFVSIDNKLLRVRNKLFVFSAEKLLDVDSNVLENINHTVELSLLSVEQLSVMIQSRLSYMKVTFDPVVPLQIADRARTTTCAMNIVRIAYMLIRSDCRSHMSLTDAQNAIKLFNKPSVPTPTSRTRKS